MNPEDRQHITQDVDSDIPASSHMTTEPRQAESITRIADLQRMNIDQLTQFARHIGLKNLGALTKSQVVFEVVKFISAIWSVKFPFPLL